MNHSDIIKAAEIAKHDLINWRGNSYVYKTYEALVAAAELLKQVEVELAKYRKVDALHEEYRQSCIDQINGKKS